MTLDDREPVVEQADVAAKLVDDIAAEPRPLGWLKNRPGADQAGDHAASIDVGNQDDRNICRFGEAHVGDVAGTQIDLRRAAGAFDQQEVTFPREPREAFQDDGQQLRLQVLVVARLGGAEDPPLYHDLRANLRLRFQQHRVHVGRRRHAASASLQRLRSTDLAAIGGHCGIVRHVLRLERSNAQPAARIRSRQTCHDQRLADVGTRALQH